MSFQPMLAYKAKPRKPLDLAALVYPVAGSYKFDGFRAVVRGRRLLSRNLKPIQNRALRAWLESMPELEGCDGELIHGDPCAPDAFKMTSSAVTTRSAPRDGVSFHVFDNAGCGLTSSFRARAAGLRMTKFQPGIVVVRHQMLQNARQVLEFEEKALALGYEGIMLRALDAPYKFGRSTLREQYLVAVKRFEDFEAEILDVLPRMRNENEQERDAVGRAKRSKRKEGMVPLPVLGKFLVREIKGRRLTMECSAGTFTLDECARLWRIRRLLRSRVLKCRRQPDATGKRFPRAMGFRSRIDF